MSGMVGGEVMQVEVKDGEGVCGLYNPLFGVLPVKEKAVEVGEWRELKSVGGEGCEAYEGSEWKGKVVLVKRGVCSFYEKAKRVMEAGGVMLIVENSEKRVLVPSANRTAGEYDDVKIPVALISSTSGEYLRGMEDQNVKVYGVKETFLEEFNGLLASISLLAIALFVVIVGSFLANEKKTNVSSVDDIMISSKKAGVCLT